MTALDERWHGAKWITSGCHGVIARPVFFPNILYFLNLALVVTHHSGVWPQRGGWHLPGCLSPSWSSPGLSLWGGERIAPFQSCQKVSAKQCYHISLVTDGFGKGSPWLRHNLNKMLNYQCHQNYFNLTQWIQYLRIQSKAKTPNNQSFKYFDNTNNIFFVVEKWKCERTFLLND